MMHGINFPISTYFLSYFHRGQIEVAERKDYAVALDSFKHALDAAVSNEEDSQS